MGTAHTQDGLVKIDARCADASELEAFHHVLVGLFCVIVGHAGLRRGVGRETIDKALLYEVVAKVHEVLAANGHGHIDRPLPVAVGQQLEHHQLALREVAHAAE